MLARRWRPIAKPPKELLGPVAGIVRAEIPHAVATLRTRRVVTYLRGSGGDVLAEVADDTVTASVPPTRAGSPVEVQAWREVEVELGTGDDALAAALGERLTGAGARMLQIGDWVWFRHAKSGELAEHTNQVHLLSGNAFVDSVPSYRGLGLVW